MSQLALGTLETPGTCANRAFYKYKVVRHEPRKALCPGETKLLLIVKK